MHCYRIARSAFGVHCDHRVARHPWRTLPLTEPVPKPVQMNRTSVSRIILKDGFDPFAVLFWYVIAVAYMFWKFAMLV